MQKLFIDLKTKEIMGIALIKSKEENGDTLKLISVTQCKEVDMGNVFCLTGFVGDTPFKSKLTRKKYFEGNPYKLRDMDFQMILNKLKK
ncbi:hypothetical protein [Bacillus sonorensis]|uniref:hypothetical protein n=1 Tax=Bacillus sonorensis TaxID=119858 RepID=UPI002DBABF93|nr:hypothetical protein [Bacillus sonorensis]MEC0341989.1 hypothetical protein [Bacillus sonorensis]MEC0457497.1 hypothetical protein [Bacillus sonorensis]MEC0530708.1 hypothetical protein [Bacillus sonorensis]